MTPDVSLINKIRRRLVRAWQPFFGRFGGLTEVQQRTIPAIMRGHQVVVCAPTATGKTEAVAAPVAERHVAEQWPGLAVIYVVPTRALGNDLFARLEGPLGEMYLTCALKHGDHPHLPRGEFHWLITTPESLDSLVCRHPNLFQTLRTVIIDEIHLLDGTYRGDQLRILLARLRKLTAVAPLAVHLLSATLPEPAMVAARYLTEWQLIEVANPRKIEQYLLSTHEKVWALAQEQQWRKLLYFCNTRQNVEDTARQVQELWKPYPVVTHHGSLERENREEAEEVMKQNQVAICVATSTLEIGIDIGDIDLVVLAEPPWSLEALQQRVGRGNRRGQVINAAALYRSAAEREFLEDLFNAIANGIYQPRSYKADLSVIVQQLFSLLYHMRTGVAWEELIALFTPLATPGQIKDILLYLCDKGYCLELGDTLCPATDLLDLGDKGMIHSNIPDQTHYRVVDSSSGRTIGRIQGSFDEVFLLAGQSWRVIKVEGEEIWVRRHARTAGNAIFGRQRNVGQFHHLLPPELRTRQ